MVSFVFQCTNRPVANTNQICSKQTTELIILSGQLLFLNKDVKPERRRAEKRVNVRQQVDVLGLKRDY